MPLRVTFSDAGGGQPFPDFDAPTATVRFFPAHGEHQALRSRILHPRLLVELLGDEGRVVSPPGRNVLLWRVDLALSAGETEDFRACKHCGAWPPLEFERSVSSSRTITQHGVRVAGFVTHPAQQGAMSHYVPVRDVLASVLAVSEEDGAFSEWSVLPDVNPYGSLPLGGPSAARLTASVAAVIGNPPSSPPLPSQQHPEPETPAPAVVYGALGRNGRRSMSLAITCSSFFHNRRRFIVRVQMLGFDDYGNITHIEEGRSVPLHVVSKFYQNMVEVTNEAVSGAAITAAAAMDFQMKMFKNTLGAPPPMMGFPGLPQMPTDAWPQPPQYALGPLYMQAPMSTGSLGEPQRRSPGVQPSAAPPISPKLPDAAAIAQANAMGMRPNIGRPPSRPLPPTPVSRIAAPSAAGVAPLSRPPPPKTVPNRVQRPILPHGRPTGAPALVQPPSPSGNRKRAREDDEGVESAHRNKRVKGEGAFSAAADLMNAQAVPGSSTINGGVPSLQPLLGMTGSGAFMPTMSPWGASMPGFYPFSPMWPPTPMFNPGMMTTPYGLPWASMAAGKPGSGLPTLPPMLAMPGAAGVAPTPRATTLVPSSSPLGTAMLPPAPSDSPAVMATPPPAAAHTPLLPAV